MTSRTSRVSLTLAAAVFAAAAGPAAQQQGDPITVPLTDPARPAVVRVVIHTGGIVVRGGNRRDIQVIARGDDARLQAPPPAGLRRLTQAAGLVIAEENNTVTVSTGGRNRDVDLELQVPPRVNLNVTTHNDGDIVVENIEGDLEAQNHNGAIHLANIAGSAVANTHNGDVQVRLTRITADKAMSFITYNGDVDVTLPANARANLKLRSDNGEIFTDFDVQMRAGAAPQPTRDARGRNRIEINQSIYGSINGGGPEFELRTYNGNVYVRRGQ